MAITNQKSEHKQIEQTALPDRQVELTDEQLEQVVGGGIIWEGITWPPGPTVTRTTFPPGPTVVGPDI